jgi:pimeloyl-ACP methyl ester carboxylesterase
MPFPTLRRRLVVVLLLPLAGSACAALAAAAAASSADPGPLVLAPCRLEQPARLQSYAAECGHLTVPENRAEPEGRTLDIFVARVPAISRRKLADPLFVIAGGPGQASSDFYASVAPVFARIGRERDIVLVDQRGTGRSHRLDCAFDDEALLNADLDSLARAARLCRATLAAQADLRQYTTDAAVEDLDAVRRALKVARIDLYGISYGSRVAQEYARRHPDTTRALILDGVVAPQTVLGPDMAVDAEAALDRILERCRQEPTCRARFADPAADYRALHARLTTRPEPLQLADPDSGERHGLAFSDEHLALVLRLASYSADQAALLPLALHRARVDGDFTPLGVLYLLATHAIKDQLATGMQESVLCTEDLPFIGNAPRDAQVRALAAVCAEWPRGEVATDFHGPFRSRAPALLLSGGDDPVTPPAEAELAARNFSDHQHLVLPGLGHGQLTAPCIDRLMANFLDAGTARALDTSCTRHIRPLPFFTSLAGPAP